MHARIYFSFLSSLTDLVLISSFNCDAFIIRSGLREYIGANPALASVSSTTIIHSKSSDFSESNSEYEVAEGADEFYDATDDSSSSEDEDDNNNDKNNQVEVNKV